MISPKFLFVVEKAGDVFLFTFYHTAKNEHELSPRELFVLESSAIIEVGHVQLLARLCTRSNGDHYSIRFNQSLPTRGK